MKLGLALRGEALISRLRIIGARRPLPKPAINPSGGRQGGGKVGVHLAFERHSVKLRRFELRRIGAHARRFDQTN
jgi:hypothetical protein